MKTIMALVFAMSLAGNLAAEKGGNGSVAVSPPPKVIQAVSKADFNYEPTRWPMFTGDSSDNHGCAENLRINYSGKLKNGTAPQRSILNASVNFNKDIGEAYKKTAKIIVTWTVRVEAYTQAINLWTNNPRLCHPWHGTSYQSFPGGDVTTALYANGVKQGSDIAMTFPALGSGSNYNASDPTITGSVTLTPASFGGDFPKDIQLDIRLANDTVGSSVKVPAYMSTMTAFVLPITQ